MAKAKPEFQRMLLRLPHSRQDYPAVENVAQLASLLRVDLIGTYFEDSNLLQLAELPGAREFRSGDWQFLDPEQLAKDLAFAANEAKRLFAAATQGQPTLASFNLAKGALAEQIASSAGGEDIIAIIEPKRAIERVTHQFNELLAAAFASVSSILLVPSSFERLVGPVFVVATNPDDPSLAAAIAVARTAREKLIVLPEQTSNGAIAAIINRAKAAGVAATVVRPPSNSREGPLLAATMGRLLIMRRSDSLGRRDLLSLRPRTPVLLVSCSETGKEEDRRYEPDSR